MGCELFIKTLKNEAYAVGYDDPEKTTILDIKKSLAKEYNVRHTPDKPLTYENIRLIACGVKCENGNTVHDYRKGSMHHIGPLGLIPIDGISSGGQMIISEEKFSENATTTVFKDAPTSASANSAPAPEAK